MSNMTTNLLTNGQESDILLTRKDGDENVNCNERAHGRAYEKETLECF